MKPEHRFLWQRAAFTMALTALASCEEATGVVECTTESITIHVMPARSPAFEWAPACGMASLEVRPAAGGPGGWVIYTGHHASENPLHSGIRYGNAPDLAVEPTPATSLVAGTTYEVTLWRGVSDGHGGASLFIAASTTFQQ